MTMTEENRGKLTRFKINNHLTRSFRFDSNRSHPRGRVYLFSMAEDSLLYPEPGRAHLLLKKQTFSFILIGTALTVYLWFGGSDFFLKISFKNRPRGRVQFFFNAWILTSTPGTGGASFSQVGQKIF